jgi:hypothetical protein
MKKEYIKPEMQVFRIESNARVLLDSVVSVETEGLDLGDDKELVITDDDSVWSGSW